MEYLGDYVPTGYRKPPRIQAQLPLGAGSRRICDGGAAIDGDPASAVACVSLNCVPQIFEGSAATPNEIRRLRLPDQNASFCVFCFVSPMDHDQAPAWDVLQMRHFTGMLVVLGIRRVLELRRRSQHNGISSLGNAGAW